MADFERRIDRRHLDSLGLGHPLGRLRHRLDRGLYPARHRRRRLRLRGSPLRRAGADQAPDGLHVDKAIDGGDGSVDLNFSWTGVSGAAGYHVLHSSTRGLRRFGGPDRPHRRPDQRHCRRRRGDYPRTELLPGPRGERLQPGIALGRAPVGAQRLDVPAQCVAGRVARRDLFEQAAVVTQRLGLVALPLA